MSELIEQAKELLSNVPMTIKVDDEIVSPATYMNIPTRLLQSLITELEESNKLKNFHRELKLESFDECDQLKVQVEGLGSKLEAAEKVIDAAKLLSGEQEGWDNPYSTLETHGYDGQFNDDWNNLTNALAKYKEGEE